MAGIERIVMADFTGGQVPRLNASDFSERQWANIRGLVLEDPERLRSQWPCQRIGAGADGFVDFGVVLGVLVAKKADGTFWWAPYPLSFLTFDQTRAIEWTQITSITADPELRILGQVPFRDPDSTGVGFTEGLLINGRDRAGDAYVIVSTGSSQTPSISTFAYPKYPSGGDPFIPPGDVATMWGDFLVLGDIRWLDDEGGAFSASNERKHPNALWFSDPTDIGKWDVLDVTFVSFYDNIGSGNIAVRDMQQVDLGLMVITHSGLALLAGTADDFVFEPLRAGTGAARRGTATFWSQTGSVCWIDAGGRLWATNGQEFSHVNEGTGLPARKDVATDCEAFLGHLVVAHADGRMLALRALETEAIWTELIPPTQGVNSLTTTGGIINWLDDAGACWRFTLSDVLDHERGMLDGVPTELRLATRTVERGGGHETSMWHRAGIRAKGPGKVKRITLRPGPALDPDQPTLHHDVDRAMDRRFDLVVRGHGPSAEASVDVRLEGDLQVESVSLHVHAGRGDR